MADEEEWVLGKSEDAGRLMICRWRKDMRAVDPARPVKITVGVMFTSRRPDGMPGSPAENDFLGGVEEALANEFRANGATFVLVVTANGAREWVAYAPSADWLSEWAPGFAARHFGDRPHDINAIYEPSWETYLAFTAA
jgi:hypothetical protein